MAEDLGRIPSMFTSFQFMGIPRETIWRLDVTAAEVQTLVGNMRRLVYRKHNVVAISQPQFHPHEYCGRLLAHMETAATKLDLVEFIHGQFFSLRFDQRPLMLDVTLDILERWAQYCAVEKTKSDWKICEEVSDRVGEVMGDM